MICVSCNRNFVPFCNKDICRKCYDKQRREKIKNGSWHSKTMKERFMEKTNQDGPIPNHCPELGKCWQWTGTIHHGTNRGHFTINNKKVYAHRASYIIHFGSIPEGKQINHKCDNRLCVRPEHLEAGTQMENMADCKKKGRIKSIMQYNIITNRNLHRLSDNDLTEAIKNLTAEQEQRAMKIVL